MSNTKYGKNGWTPDRIQDLTGKTYLITGTTSGTGYEAARILLSKGAKVVMLNRNPKKSTDSIAKLKETLGNNIDVSAIKMDLADQNSIKSAAKEVLETVSQIDALLCNAAIAQTPNRNLTPEGWEVQMGVNYFGHFTLQALLYPLIEKSKGRIVTVGSLGYDMGIKAIKFDDLSWEEDYSPNNAYSQSKLAQIMSMYELNDRLKATGKSDVKAYACHPGSSRTSLIATSGSFMMKMIFGIMKLTPLTQPAENGAYPQLMCATEPNLDENGFYGPTGRSNWVGPVGAHEIKSHAKDKAASKRLWELSEKETGVSWEI
ncbi:MAG: SDR family oxidoreductase [Crocinitomicaceae bacterium]